MSSIKNAQESNNTSANGSGVTLPDSDPQSPNHVCSAACTHGPVRRVAPEGGTVGTSGSIRSK